MLVFLFEKTAIDQKMPLRFNYLSYIIFPYKDTHSFYYVSVKKKFSRCIFFDGKGSITSKMEHILPL